MGDTVPEALVFMGLDVIGGGGATRTMASVKNELRRAGRIDIWDNRWDSFLNMPVTIISCTYQEPRPTQNSDSTFPLSPPSGSLRWKRQSALHHELVHALLNFGGDIYGGKWYFDTWFEVMSFSWPTDYPIPMSSYLRERCGFCTIRNMPRQTHLSLLLDPLETHSDAVRFQNGPIHAPETIVLENRRCFDYRVNPPTPQQNILFAYNIDPKSRRIQSNGVRLTGRVIKRNAQLGDMWGHLPDATSGINLVGQGQDLANTLSPTGEHWWDFRNILTEPDNRIRLDAVYQHQDLVAGYQSATWSNSRGVDLSLDGLGEILSPNIQHGAKGHVLMVGRSAPIIHGRRYDHVLNVHPDWNEGGVVWGNYRVPIPSEGARLYVTAALSETAVGSDGVQLAIQVNGVRTADYPLSLRRNIRTFAIDLLAERNSMANISIGVLAGENAVRDWAYILEAVVVPTAPVLIDLLGLASVATWRSNTGNISFNGDIAPQGHAREEINIPLQNGVVYGRRLLYMHPAWSDEGFIEGSFPVTLPNQPSVFRAELGFPESRTVTDNGALFSVRFIDSAGNSTDILMRDQSIRPPLKLLLRNPAMGEKGLENNPTLAPAVPLPTALQGLTGELVLRVDADGSASEDQVYWTMARITSD